MKKNGIKFTLELGESQSITPELLERQLGIANIADYDEDMGEPDSEIEVEIEIK